MRCQPRRSVALYRGAAVANSSSTHAQERGSQLARLAAWLLLDLCRQRCARVIACARATASFLCSLYQPQRFQSILLFIDCDSLWIVPLVFGVACEMSKPMDPDSSES